MSRYERTGERNLSVSAWHRTLSHGCTCIDIDFLEYCQKCREPLALIETAKGHHSIPKPTTVIEHLAAKAGIHAYLLLYDLKSDGSLDEMVRWNRIFPIRQRRAPMGWDQVAEEIESIHKRHQCIMGHT